MHSSERVTTPAAGVTVTEWCPAVVLAVAPRIDDWLLIVGRAIAAIEVLRVFAQHDEALVLPGPAGVGNMRLARWRSHAQAPRSSRLFETLDRLIIPAELGMAEPFGWRGGVSTGLVTRV